MTIRGRALDWAWNHPRWKRRMREAWGASREVAAHLSLPRPFDPSEFPALRRLAVTAADPPAEAPRVLFMSWRGWSTHLAIETVLAHAVMRKGARPVFVTCAGRLPICDVMPVDAAPPMPCHSCREYAFGATRAAGFPALGLRDGIDVAAAVTSARHLTRHLHSVQSCEEFTCDGLEIGRLVRISVAWFLSRGSLPDSPAVRETYRSFLVSGIVVARGLRALLDRTKPSRVFMLNGSFFAERIMAALASERGIPFATYEKGFIHDSIVATPDAAACYLTIPDDAWEQAREASLTAAESDAVDAYLGQRRHGGGTLDNFWRERLDDVACIREALALRAGHPLVVMFCNILWDSAVLERDIGFTSMGEWIIQGIDWAARHPEVDLVIRVHPAEVQLRNHPTRERTVDHIAEHVDTLPANVRIVPADDPTSSYALMDEATMGLVYTSTVGLEMAARGLPVVVAGRTHYRSRGFTLDPERPAEYWEAADRVLELGVGADERQRIRELACRYAALFFFRFQHVLRAVHEPGRSRPQVRLWGAADLDPGRDPELDLLVETILDGTPAISPRREILVSPASQPS